MSFSFFMNLSPPKDLSYLKRNLNVKNKSLKAGLNVSKKANNLKYQLVNKHFPLLKNQLQNSSLEFKKSISVTFHVQKSNCGIGCLSDNHYQLVMRKYFAIFIKPSSINNFPIFLLSVIRNFKFGIKNNSLY